MKGTFKKAATVFLLFTFMFSLCSFSAFAANSENGESGESKLTRTADAEEYATAKNDLTAKKVTDRSIYSYSSVSVTKDGYRLSTDARKINGVTYVALRSFANEIGGMNSSYYSSTRTMIVKGGGLEMSISDGSNIVYANGRSLYSITPNVIMSNDRMYTPLESLAKAMGFTFSESSQTRVNISGSFKPIKHGSVFYDQDAVYWLSRIISSESKGEPLLGQIAVGNVVLNRVRSPLYPNTIWGVIFDKKYGVQFSPILNGTIYSTPTATAITAAKICLEGYSISNDALFFLQPRLSTSSWIPKSREYIFSIGNHDFYK